MGNAFTAIADDEEAIFFNPAGLAGVRKFSLNLATIGLEVSDELLAEVANIMAIVGNPGVDSINQLMGKNLYARAQGYASLVLPGFGIAALGDQQTAIRIKNPYYPEMTIGGQTTYGFQMGFGFSILKLKKKRGQLRMGLAGKMLWRGGGYQNLSLSQLMAFDTSTLLGSIGNMGIGYGVDSGLQFEYNVKKKITLLAGLAYTNMGGVAFASGADPLAANLTAGLGMRVKGWDTVATLAFDYSHILDAMDFRKKTHLGLELQFPLISLSVGLNQLSLCYGASVDLAIVKVGYVSYAEELSSVSGINPERRHLLNLSMKLDLY
jgi:hypothetical protein